ncbi:hypothetical protein RCH14_000066 [Massilia sp. MP_M2]|uniref:hypothetical protein n=1 Tax=Massilia sp. MP_M2 TaxID=3071713 RepID=UPI00319E08F5
MTAPINLQRHALIERAVLVLGQRGESSVTLWTSIATALGKIIGHQGFDSLLVRCMNELEPDHPWLAGVQPADTGALTHLSTLLASRAPEESERASAALLHIFADTLILLVGELVTNRILHSAWKTLAVEDASEPSK